jgi:hypothetical protein
MFNEPEPNEPETQLEIVLSLVNEIKYLLEDIAEVQEGGNLNFTQVAQLIYDTEPLSIALLKELQATVGQTENTLTYELVAELPLFELLDIILNSYGHNPLTEVQLEERFGHIPQFEVKLTSAFKNNCLNNKAKLSLINRSNPKQNSSIDINLKFKLNKVDYLASAFSDWLLKVFKTEDSDGNKSLFSNTTIIFNSVTVRLPDVKAWLETLNKNTKSHIAELEAGKKKAYKVSFHGMNNFTIILSLCLLDNQLTFKLSFQSQLNQPAL